jgi:hypothetical protein
MQLKESVELYLYSPSSFVACYRKNYDVFEAEHGM